MLQDGVTTWSKYPHAIALGDTFKTYDQVIEFAMQPAIQGSTNASEKTGLAEYQDSFKMGELEYYTKPNYADTSVGGNDAINPYWQFNIDDDIIHPLTSVDGIGKNGMGRVYSEKYENNQQILWMTMGIPRYTNLAEFFTESVIEGMAGLMNNGTVEDFGMLSRLIAKGVILAITLPFLPLIAVNKLMRIVNDIPVTKYYGFRNAMSQYYRMVNTILAQLAAGMGLIPLPFKDAQSGGLNENNYRQLFDQVGAPEVLRHGPDVFAMMQKRALRMKGTPPITADELIEDFKKRAEARSWYDKFSDSLIGGMLGGTDFIGFRIERTVDSSENISNQTGQSAIAQKLNQRAAEKMSQNRDLGNGWVAMGKNLVDLTGKIKAAMGAFNKETAIDLGLQVVSGAGMYDIPEVWQDSTFSRSYNFTVKLRSRYGDPVSIFQSEYIPLAMLLAAALPRAVGKNTYTSPFLIRAYCKGMFSVPLGIIDNMSIRRGAPEFGWNYTQLPLEIEVSFTIKDLSPSFFVTMGDLKFLDIIGRNDNMQEYIATLSGIGLSERYYLLVNIRRRFAAWWHIQKTTKFSPIYWGGSFGRSALPRAISSVIPYDYVSQR